MKKSNTLIKGIVASVLLLAASGYVYAAELPVLSKFCEYKSGEIKSVGSGFSILKKCPNNSRAVIISGEQGPVGPTGPQGPQGLKGDAGTLVPTNLYTKVDGPFTATDNIASTVAHGCNPGDMVIGGGLYIPGGNIANWRTIKSHPQVTEPSDVETTMNGWETTVINTVESANFYTLARCYDLQ